MKKFVSMYQPTNSKSFYSAINQNKNLNLFKITDKYLEKYASSACKSKEWDSLPFQEFVKVFMGENTPYNSILITWGTGVGKTCGAVQITESLRPTVQMFHKYIYIIAPANLQQNYKETLLSECSGNKHNNGEENISSTYKFYSYLKFGKLIEKIYAQGGEESLIKKFSNCVFVIDEAHNLNNLKEDEETKKELEEETKKELKEDEETKKELKEEEEQNSQDNTTERRLLNTLELLFGTIKNSKLILLTATPIRNNISEIASLMNLLRLNNGESKIDEEKAFGNDINVNYLLQMFKGYVSYVKGNSQISFPKIEDQGILINPYPNYDHRGKTLEYKIQYTKVIPCEMTSYQLAYYLYNSMHRKSGKFNNVLTTISNVALPIFDDNGKIIKTSITKIKTLEEFITHVKGGKIKLGSQGHLNADYPIERSFFLCKEYLPYFSTKINKLLDNLLQPGVHYVYSRLVQFGTTIISVACQLFGWNILRVNAEGDITFNYSLLDYNNIIKRCWCGQLETEHTNSHEFQQGHIVIYTGDANTNQKALKNLLAIINSEENKNGQLCKVFIGSRVSGEGVNYKRLRYVHILEPWWNNTVLQQVIGRAARNCSHFDLSKEFQNVLVYRYTSVFPKSLDSIEEIYPQFNKVKSKLLKQLNNETVYMSMYRLAESKDLRISYLTRLLKISAVDCVTNYIWNRVWTESEIAHLKKHHKYTVGKNTFEIDDNAIKLLNIGEDKTPDCEYMDCNYTCMEDEPIETNDTSVLYNYLNINKQKILVKINQIIDFINKLHTPIFSLSGLMEYFNINVIQSEGFTKLDYYNIFDALTEMLTNQDITFEWNGITGRLRMMDTSDGIIYAFDSFSNYIDDPSSIPLYFKYNNVFTNGSNISIDVKNIDKTLTQENDYNNDIIKYINEASSIIKNNSIPGPELMEFFDNLNNIVYPDVNLTPFNLFYEALENFNDVPELKYYVDYYMQKNYRSNTNDFYISHTNFSVRHIENEEDKNEWTIIFSCRYKVNGFWKSYQIINTTYGNEPFEKIGFAEYNERYVVKEKGLSDMYFTIDDADIRSYIGEIMTKLIRDFKEYGIKNASTQASIIYEYFSPSNTIDTINNYEKIPLTAYNVKIINDSRGNLKRNDKIDKRSISTGQICTSTTKLAITRTLQMINDKEINEIINNINNNREYDNNISRCKKIEMTFRKFDWENKNGKRWFYMFGDYDFTYK